MRAPAGGLQLKTAAVRHIHEPPRIFNRAVPRTSNPEREHKPVEHLHRHRSGHFGKTRSGKSKLDHTIHTLGPSGSQSWKKPGGCDYI